MHTYISPLDYFRSMLQEDVKKTMGGLLLRFITISSLLLPVGLSRNGSGSVRSGSGIRPPFYFQNPVAARSAWLTSSHSCIATTCEAAHHFFFPNKPPGGGAQGRQEGNEIIGTGRLAAGLLGRGR